jgi:hypothetical protein
MHVCIVPFWSLYVLYVIAPDGALACRRQAGQELVVCLQQYQGPPTARAHIPTQHSTVHLTNHLDLNLTSLYPHVLATTALHRCCLSLSTPQAATTSVNRKRDAPSPRSIWSCRALPHPPPTYIDSDRARCSPDLCLTHKHRLCRPQSVSLPFLFSSFSSYQATTSSVLAPTAILTACFKQRANALILSRPIPQPKPPS